MTLKKNIKQQGFTIVELLIVIVVIGILAAITIVAYNGIQSRAKSSAGQQTANSVIKKAEAWNAIIGSYATYNQLNTNSLAPTGPTTPGGATGPSESKVDNTSITTNVAVTASTANGGQTVTYLGACTGGGSKIGYWDYAAATPAVVYIYIGGATAASTGCA
jgi:type IV pilus assembly protein PilA